MELTIKPAVLMAAIALYETRGVLESLAYLQTEGIVYNDALDILVAYEDAKDLI